MPDSLAIPAASIGRTRTLARGARLVALAAVAIALIVVFMTIENKGNWDFILPFRGRKILAMAIVGFAIALSTVLFHTITENRILTPSIMGFDALYMLIQTVVVFFFGSTRLLMLDPRFRFVMEVVIMVSFATVLFFVLFVRARHSLHLLLLVGIIFGVLFRSLTNFMQRLIAPNDFVILQDAGFASFNSVDRTLLGITAVIVAALSAIVFWQLRRFDVMLLGREAAISLGVNHRATVTITIVIVTSLVAVSTALVGPITFFGLLVANLAYMVMGTSFHRWTIPAAAFLALIALVGGQLILERVFTFNSSLSVMIEFFGGTMFLYLVLRGHAR